MAKHYTLQHNEAVLRSGSRVMRGDGIFWAFKDDLLLTNFNLVWTSKGIFGNVQQIECLPLGLVKVHNDQAQAFLTKSSGGWPQLTVVFQNGEEVFTFQSGGTREVGEWVDAINRAVTGNAAGPGTSGSSVSMALPGTEELAETLRDTVSQFRNAFRVGAAVSSAPPPPVRVSSRCASCGASISGITRTVAKCRYCDTESRLP